MRGCTPILVGLLVLALVGATPAAADELAEAGRKLERAGRTVLQGLAETGGALLEAGTALGERLEAEADRFLAPGGQAEQLGQSLGDGLDELGRSVGGGLEQLAGGFDGLIGGPASPRAPGGLAARAVGTPPARAHAALWGAAPFEAPVAPVEASVERRAPEPPPAPRPGERWVRIEAVGTQDVLEVHVQPERVDLYFNGVDLADVVGPETFSPREWKGLEDIRARRVPVRVEIWD